MANAAAGGSNALPKFECPDTINAVYQYPGYHVVYDGTLVGSLEGGNIVFRSTLLPDSTAGNRTLGITAAGSITATGDIGADANRFA